MSFKNIGLGLLTLIFIALMIGGAATQIGTQENAIEVQTVLPGRNVNMVSGTVLPGGDPWLQRQNEPSSAVSTRNPMHILAAANDYRTVDMPFSEGELPGIPGYSAGDAWIGIFKSFDGGESWYSDMLEGYPQAGPTPTPLYGYDTAADPVIRSGPAGMFYLTGICFDRAARDESIVFVSRFIDNNNVENFRAGGDPIEHLDSKGIVYGNDGQFPDKPWIAVDKPRGTGTISINGQPIPQHNIYIAHTVFVGNLDKNIRSKVMFKRSTDCGQTWQTAIKLNADEHINQGTQIAVDPIDGTVYVVWRRFNHGGDLDGIVCCKSTDFGQSFTNPIDICTFDPSPLGAFDQPSSSLTEFPPEGEAFRSNTYPALTMDGQGILYCALSERGWTTSGDARIMLYTSSGGASWNGPFYVADHPDVGHQIMPAIAFGGGKLSVIWYDQKYSVGGNNCGVSDWINDQGMPNCAWRETLDVFVAQAEPGFNPLFELPMQVSRYLWGLQVDGNGVPIKDVNGYPIAQQLQFNPPNYPLFRGGQWPFIGDYIDLAASPSFVFEGGNWQYNLYGTTPPVFHAVWTDNRDVRPPLNNDWTNYTPPASVQINEGFADISCASVIPTNTGMRNQNIYTSKITRGIIVVSPNNNKPLGTLGNYLGEGEIPRAFVIYVSNPFYLPKSFRLTILQGGAYAPSSFLEFDNIDEIDATVAGYSTIARSVFVYSGGGTESVKIDVEEIYQPGGGIVPDGLVSSIVLNPDPSAPGDLINEEVHNPNIANPNIANPNILNPNILNWSEAANPNIANPNILNPNILNPNIANPNILNPNILNPNILNPNILNPNIANPNILNPNILNPNIANPNILNPNILNPNILNPNILNPNILNPNILNPNIANYTPEEADRADITDAFWLARNDGNTSSTYTFKMFSKDEVPPGIYMQLLIYRVHYTPSADFWEEPAGGTLSVNTEDAQCDLKVEPHHELILNVVNPNILNPNIANPNILNPNILNAAIENTVFSLEPGEEVAINLRVVEPDPSDFKVLSDGSFFDVESFLLDVGVSATGHAVNTVDAQNGIKTPPVFATQLIIGNTSLPDGEVNVPYARPDGITVKLHAFGGDGIYTWDLNSGELPYGLGLSGSGEITGTPTTAGVFDFVVKVEDGLGRNDTQEYTIIIYAAGTSPTLAITTTSPLPNAVKSVWYGARLEASGGIWPRKWKLADDSLPLPPGLSLDSGGLISGTPTEVGTYSFSVTVLDRSTPIAQTDTKAFQLEVKNYNPLDKTNYPDIIISGTIYASVGGIPLQGVLLRGVAGENYTDSNGFYTLTVPYQWSGTVEPFMVGYSFTPENREYGSLTADQTGQDYNESVNPSPTEDWSAVEASGNLDDLRDMTVDAQGNIYVTGGRSGTYYTIKYNNVGVQQWARQFGDGGDYATALCVDAVGNVFVTGTYNDDYHTIRYTSGGTADWSDTYDGGGGMDEAYDIVVDALGNVYITGLSFAGSDLDFCTIKYKPSGGTYARDWVQRFDGGGPDAATRVAVDDAGNVIVAGRSFAPLTLDDMFVIKYDSQGNMVWMGRHTFDSNDHIHDMCLDSAGNIFVTGYVENQVSSYSDRDYCTVKFAGTNGAWQWATYYDGGNTLPDEARAIACDANGDVYVTGGSGIFQVNWIFSDYYTIKYDGTNGAVLWETNYNGAANADDEARDIAVDPHGFVYVTGYSVINMQPYDSEFVSLKYNQAGNQVWEAKYDSVGAVDAGRRIALDPFGGVVVSGVSSGNFTTLMYEQPLTSSVTIQTLSLPNGVVGQAYTAAVQVFGGVPPYTWTTNPAQLPSGLALNGATGVISGIPSATGPSTFTVTVTDFDGNVDFKAFTITIDSAPPPPAAYLVVSGNSTMEAGTSKELTVTAYDSGNSVATSYTGHKQLVFSGPVASPSGVEPTLAGVPLGTPVNVNFTNGVSDASECTLFTYCAEDTSVDVSDGSIDSTGSDAYDYDVTVEPAAGDATQSLISEVTPDPANVGDPIEVAITVYDQFQNLTIDGANVSVTVTGANNVAASASSNGDGTYSFGYTANSGGTDTITATVNSIAVVPSHILTINVPVVPDINIKQDTTDIPDGGTFDFGSAYIGEFVDVVFTIENTGAANLNLGSGSLSGANSDQFSIQQQPSISVITPGGSTTFLLRFAPTALGLQNATFEISSDDPDETPYDFSIQGTGDSLPDQFTRITTGAIVEDGGNSFGCAWGDYDNDGDLDLFAANSADENNFLYTNNGDNSFTKVTTGAMVADGGNSYGCAWGDYDNDGDLDLFVINHGQNNFLYTNNGAGSFTKVTTGAVVTDEGYSRGCAWGDYDNDGDLDLFVLNNNHNNFLYANNGAGSFTKVTSGTVVEDAGDSRSCAWGDFDNDGDLDLFITNYDLDNCLYENNGDGSFTKVTSGAVVTDGGPSIDCAWGDFDNDGDLDLFVANYSQDNFLYTNNGDGSFTKVTSGAVVTDGGPSFGCAWGDYDNDGDLDLFAANYQQNNFLYTNNGAGSFTKVTSGVVVTDGGASFGCAWGDYDNDGDLDLFVANHFQNNLLFMNNGNSNNWIDIECVGAASNISSIGTNVKVNALIDGNPVWQMREISGGTFSQDSLNAEFGLGDATIVDEIRIEWPSGQVQTLTDVAVNQFLVVNEPALPTPQINSITPSSGTNTENALNVSIFGTNFLNGAQVELNFDGGDVVSATSVLFIDSTEIQCEFDLTGVTEHLGEPWDVLVINPGAQSNTLEDGFIVGRPNPTITSIDPNSGSQGASVTVTIAGTNFVDGFMTVTLQSGVTDFVATILSVDSSSIDCTFDLTGAVLGSYDLIVSVGGALASAELQDGFTVIAIVPSQIELSGPDRVGGGFVSNAIAVTSLDGGGLPLEVTQDTSFNLSSNSSGIFSFYSDAEGTTPISQVTILNGQSSARFYYMDQTLGSPQVTATWASGGSNLGQDTHLLDVWPVVGQIAFGSDRDGDDDIYIMNADGTAPWQLTNDPASDRYPEWSAQGDRIVFVSDRDGNDEIYLMSADGSGQTRLTDNSDLDVTPSFSPDGSKIAFVSARDGNFEIYVMNADGTGQTNLTSNPAGDMHPSWSPDGDEITFHSERDGNYNVYVMNSDGTGQTRLTDNPEDDAAPSWSQDGSIIAFMSNRDGNWEIYAMNPDGTDLSRVTNSIANDMYPSWSPDRSRVVFYSEQGLDSEIKVINVDGTGEILLTDNTAADVNPHWGGAKIAFTSERDGGGEIYVMNTNGSGQTRLTSSSAADSFPSWSPDGTKIAFASERDANWEIYVMNADGSGQTNLTNNPALERSSCWSPDGSQIVFESDRDGNDEIYVMDAGGSGQTRLTINSSSDQSASWSPDGAKIVFHSNRDGNYEIYVMNVDGTGQTRLSNNTAYDMVPSWSPDGSKIAFWSSRDGTIEIYVMNADGSEQTRLTSNSASDMNPSWSPDGSMITFMSDRDGSLEIYVMNADGSNQTRLTNNLVIDGVPNWRPKARFITPIMPLVVLTESIPYGVVGQPYSAQLEATGGIPPYEWSFSSFSSVTEWLGLTLDQTTGELTGTPDTWQGGNKNIYIKDASLPQLEASGEFTYAFDRPFSLAPVSNASFESGTGGSADGWIIETGSCGMTVERVETMAYSGTSSIKFDCPSGCAGPCNAYIHTQDFTQLDEYKDSYIHVKMFYTGSPSANEYISITLERYSLAEEPGGTVSQGYVLTDFDPNEWVEIPPFPVQIPQTDYPLKIKIKIQRNIPAAETSNATVWIDDVEFRDYEGPMQYFITQPVNTEQGQVITPAPQVKAVDAYGEGVQGVEITLEAVSGGGTLQGTTAVTTDALGVATFDNIWLDDVGTYKLRATGWHTFVDSATFQIEATPPDQFTKITTGEVVTDGGNSRGIAWGDFNNDSNLDLFVANDDIQDNLLYRNNGDGSFTKVTSGIIVSDGGWSSGCSWGDLDNDEDLDLFVSNLGGQNNYLYTNDGDGSFTKITAGTIVSDGGNSSGCAWGDYNNDGSLDLFVSNRSEEANDLYTGAGDGSFSKVTSGAIVLDGGNSRGCAWGDFDNDNDLDLFVANDVNQNNFLYVNNGDSSFTKVTAGAIVTDVGSSVGCVWADYDNDGDLDLFVANYSQANFLYSNNNDGSFTKITSGNIVTDVEQSLGCVWADYDNDGDLDLFVANYMQNDSLYSNNGDGSFEKIITGVVVTAEDSSWDGAWADYDSDGDLDLFVSNADEQDNFLYANNGNGNGWISIKCVGTASNYSAIGAKVRVNATIGGSPVWQLREISGGTYSQDSLNPEFGLGDATIIDEIRVEWPSGKVQTLTDVAINHILSISEPVATPAPEVLSVIPDSGNTETESLIVTITGTNFADGAIAELNFDDTDNFSATSTNFISSSELQCIFNLTGISIHLGEAWDVKVTNPDAQSGTGENLFTIYLPNPIVTAITPASGLNTGSIAITNLEGTNFVTGVPVFVRIRKGEVFIEATDKVVVSDTQITCTFDLTGAEAGAWIVVVVFPSVCENLGALPNGFTVTAPIVATQLVFTTQPGGGDADSAWSQQPVVEVQDIGGNTITSDNTTEVTLAIGSNPGGGELAGHTTVTVSSGIATFSDLEIFNQGNGYSLTASAIGLDPDISTAFNITPVIDPISDEEWDKTYDGGGSDADAAYDVATDIRGNVYVTGDMTSSSTPDLYIVKYNSDSTKEWDAVLDDPPSVNDHGEAMAVDLKGNVYVTGKSDDDILTVKYDSAGIIKWRATYDGPDSGADYGVDVAVDNDGNVYVTGVSRSGSQADYATIKYNPDGSLAWAAPHNGYNGAAIYNSTYGDDLPAAIGIDSAGNVVVTGRSEGSSGSWDYFTIQYDSSGNFVWEQRFDRNGNNDYGEDLAIDSSDNVYVTGGAITYTYWEPYTIKYNGSGSIVGEWTHGIGAVAIHPVAIAVDASENVFVTGSIGVGSTFSYYTAKYSGSGSIDWYRTFESHPDDDARAYDISLDSLGGIYVTGFTTSLNLGREWATVKYDSDGNEEWMRAGSSDGDYPDHAYAIAIDPYHNVFVAGERYDITEDFNIRLTKLNPGIEEWVKTFGGTEGDGADQPVAIASDSAGNIYVAGLLESANWFDFATIKYNSAGTKVWDTLGPGGYNHRLQSLAVDDAGNVYITGYEQKSPASDCITIKYNSLGTQAWVATGVQQGIPESIAVDSAGNVYCATYGGYGEGMIAYIVKYDGSGNELWRETLSSLVACRFSNITVDSLGNVYAAGSGQTEFTGQYLVVKFDTNGSEQWQRIYTGSGYDGGAVRDLVLDPSGNVYVTGFMSKSSPTDASDVVTIKYDNDGTQLWTSQFVGDGRGEGNSIALDSVGNVYVGGSGQGDTVLDGDMLVIKYDNDGNEQFAQFYSGPGEHGDFGEAVTVDSLGNVFITGRTTDSGGNDVCTTLKYDGTGNLVWSASKAMSKGIGITIDPSDYVYVTSWILLNGSLDDYDFITMKYKK
jgi:uncharacterized delta-60 repeat protein